MKCAIVKHIKSTYTFINHTQCNKILVKCNRIQFTTDNWQLPKYIYGIKKAVHKLHTFLI